MIISHGPVTTALLALSLLLPQPMGTEGARNASPSNMSASTDMAPIRIDRSSLAPTSLKAPRTWMNIAFRNESTVAADQVQFTVRYHGSDNVLMDKGVFSPGTRIVHNFYAGTGAPSAHDNANVVVRYVHFTDGTQWGERL